MVEEHLQHIHNHNLNTTYQKLRHHHATRIPPHIPIVLSIDYKLKGDTVVVVDQQVP
jgi:hypothetical protein